MLALSESASTTSPWVPSRSDARARDFFPVAKAQPSADEKREARGGNRQPIESAGRILVVDDDTDIRNLVAAMLRRAGYEVVCAADGEEGWTALSDGNFDFLITDHEMPRLCGLELVQRVRAADLTLPVILLSGNLPVAEREFAESFSPAAAMKKPFLPGQLLAKVRAVSSAAMSA